MSDPYTLTPAEAEEAARLAAWAFALPLPPPFRLGKHREVIDPALWLEHVRWRMGQTGLSKRSALYDLRALWMVFGEK